MWELPAGEEKTYACVQEKFHMMLKQTICFFSFVFVKEQLVFADHNLTHGNNLQDFVKHESCFPACI